MRYHSNDSIVDKIYYLYNSGLNVISVKVYCIETNNTLYGNHSIHSIIEYKDESNNTKYMSDIFNIRGNELIDIMVQDCAINDEIYRSIILNLIKNVYDKNLLRRGNENDVIKVKGILMRGYSNKVFIPDNSLICEFTDSDLKIIKYSNSKEEYKELENKINSTVYRAIKDGKFKVSTNIKDKWYIRLILRLYDEKYIK